MWFSPVSLCDVSYLTTGPVLKTMLVLLVLVEQPFFCVASCVCGTEVKWYFSYSK